MESFVAPFGYAYVDKSLGNVTTRNYSYGVTRGNKFGNLCITHLEERCIEYREKGQVPIQKVDINAAYRMATQWLAAVHVDVDSLGRCKADVKPNEFWNHLEPGEKLKGKTFVPIYDVSWTSPKARNFGVVASVQLFAPTKTLLQLNVYEADFILRQPLAVTNLAALLSATNVTRQ